MTIPPPRLEQQKQERAIQLIEFLDGVSESLLRLSPRQFIEQLPDQICEILSVSDCMLWTADHTKGSLKIKQISKELKPEALNDELDLSDPSVNGLFSVETTSFLSKSEHLFKQIASVNNWKSSLSYPIKSQSEDHPLGLLLVLTEVKRDFNKSEKRLLKILANYAALSLEQEKNDEVRRRTESLVSLMQEMTTVEEVKELWPLIRKATKTLSNSDYVWAGQWDHVRGILIGNDNSDQENENLHISIGDGITGRVIATEKPQLIGDVLKEPSYIELWPNIRSELTVPILIEKIPIREGIKIGFGSKVFGVLDLESPQINAFSKYDQQLLDVFGRYAAI